MKAAGQDTKTDDAGIVHPPRNLSQPPA